ncbi:MAG: ATP-binding cassette domain-containing protein [Nitrospirota bacterium]
MPFLQIDHASKSFPSHTGEGEVCIFNDVTIKIEQGEFVTVIGHSGCGKSTLLNIIAGLDTASEGASSSRENRWLARGSIGWGCSKTFR